MNEHRQEGARYTVLFDGDCPLCRRSVESLRVRDLAGVLDFIPAQDPRMEEAFPWISREALAASIHLVGPADETWEGAGAFEELARILPGFGWLAPLFRLPFARPVARGLYRLVARNRPTSARTRRSS